MGDKNRAPLFDVCVCSHICKCMHACMHVYTYVGRPEVDKGHLSQLHFTLL